MPAWNPYYDEWAAIHGETYAWRARVPSDDRETRGRMIHRYAFAVPNEEALACIARYAPIVEMGAGNGYWARCLRDRGVDVLAYDEMGDQWLAYFRESQLWTDVVTGGPERLGEHPDRTLLLCWPDPWSGMDEASLRAYRGRHVIYVGELGDRGPGTEGFRHLLRTAWREVERVPLPQWSECDDLLTVHERRSPWTRARHAPPLPVGDLERHACGTERTLRGGPQIGRQVADRLHRDAEVRGDDRR
jgi:hypothetical protein